jgi:hypothetical protein
MTPAQHYGCHSKPRSDGYWARNKHYVENGPPEEYWIAIKDVMSRECRYDKQRDDPKCEGCSRIVK